MTDESPDEDKLDDETKELVDKVDSIVDGDDSDDEPPETPAGNGETPSSDSEPHPQESEDPFEREHSPSPPPTRPNNNDGLHERLDQLESVVTESDGDDSTVEHSPPDEDSSLIGRSFTSLASGLGAFTSFPLLQNFGVRFWRALALTSLRNYHRNHGGDRTALEYFPNGKAKLTPVKWKSVEECDEDEGSGWKVKGRDKTYKPTTLGQGGPRLGKVPILNLDNETWRASSVLESRVAEAVDQGDHRPLYRVDEAEFDVTVRELNPAGAQRGPVSADGGQNVHDVRFNPRTHPIFEDEIIDLGSDQYDGQAVSFTKVKELMGERTTTDEMAAQEERGFRAGRSNKDMKKFLLKIFVIAALVALGGLIGPELLGVLFGGGGGGGGGGIIPI